MQRDPRVERTRLAMIEAVTSIIVEEGAAAVTHQRVAERAGVGRATVYRHWRTTEDILLSVFELFRFPKMVTKNGTLRQRLVALLRWVATQFSRPETRAFILTMSERSQRDPTVERVRRERMAEFQRGIIQVLPDPGSRAAGSNDLVMARLLGPIWFRVIVQGEKVTDEFIEGIVEDFLSHMHNQQSSRP